MTTLLKLGGSLITDKRGEKAFRQDVMRRIANEVERAHNRSPQRLVIGHGSGSFGHVPANKYGTINGVHSDDGWRGFTEVARVASELNELVTGELWNAGLPAMRIQPSASLIAHDGVPAQMDVMAIKAALDHGLIPVVHGDVAFDDVRGGTIISTETIFFYLARHLPVSRILLLGEVDGVYDPAGAVIPMITPAALPAVEAALGGSAGTDVTGGMETKVRDMVALVQAVPNLTIRIMSGAQPGLLQAALLGGAQPGTLIAAQ